MVRTFGKLALQVDKMDGLRLTGEQDEKILVKPWDKKETSDVVGKILDKDGNEIWNGIVFKSGIIDNIFKPFQGESEIPITYATRSGRLGRPKTIGYLRIETSDGENFSLVRCDGGEKPEETLVEGIKNPDTLKLVIQIGNKIMISIVFDKERIEYQKRIEKLLSREAA